MNPPRHVEIAPARRRVVARGLAVLATLGAVDRATGQTSKLSNGGGGAKQAAVMLEADVVRERSVGSFERAVANRLTKLRSRWAEDAKDAPVEQIGQIRAETLDAFQSSLDDVLSELQGDGVLTLDEVTSDVGELRERSLANLQERIRADFDDIDPPPERRNHDGRLEHIFELTRYTVVTRNPPHAWLLLLLCILVGVFVGGVVLSLGRKLRDRSSSRIARWAGRAFHVVNGPVMLASGVVGVTVGLTWVWMPTAASDFLWTVVRMFFVVAGFWLAWNLCDVIAEGIGWLVARDRSAVDHQVVDITRKGSRLFLVVILVIFVTEVLLGSDFTGLLAGLGVLGLAVSLAAQDTLKNLLGSFTIYGDKPFEVGDLILFDGHFGTVDSIGFRSTSLRTLDDHIVSIPNAELVKNDVENVSRRAFVRRRFRLDLEFETPMDKVREAMDIVREILESREHQPEDPPPRVIFEEVGEYSLRLMIEYHHAPGDYWAAKENDSEINSEILTRFEQAGVHLAFPTEVHLNRRLDAAPANDGKDPQDDEARRREPDEPADEVE